jgi:S-disulfanyl-L-cysteine oxidoreductase SoxD
MNLKLALTAILGLAGMGAFYSALRAQTTSTVWDGVYSADQAKRGDTAYHQECSNCHGDNLEGLDEAPALSGGGFLANWSGLTVGDLFDRVRTTMPADRPGHLTRAQTSDIISYILQVNQFPAGNAELSQQSEALKQIRIEATKK